MIRLKGRTIEKEVEIETGISLLELAIKNNIDWGFSCTQGNCARCRCFIEEGKEYLNEPTDEEWNRLDDDELEEGYRLGCQTELVRAGTVKAVNRTYF